MSVIRKMWHLEGVTDFAEQKTSAERYARENKKSVEVHDHRMFEACNDRCAIYGRE